MSFHQDYLNTRYFSNLDGVRSLCILAVIWHHVPHPDNLPRVMGRGFLGVDMFFVVSGFLIVTLLLREQGTYKTINLSQFYLRRILRTFPAYYGILGLFLVLYSLQSPSENRQQFFELLPIYLTLTSNFFQQQAANFGILWSLATEEQFYFFWPWVQKFASPQVLWGIWGGFFGLNQLINFGVIRPWLEKVFGVVHLEILDASFTPILLGIALAYGLHFPPTFSWLAKMMRHPWTPFGFLLVLLALGQWGGSDISGLPRLLIQGVMTLWLGSLVLPRPHCLTPMLENKIIARLGIVSYGVYLYHMWCIHAVTTVLGKINLATWWLIFMGSVVVSYGVAEISFRWWEKPFLRLKPKRQVPV